jgi:preprotein translocase subunit YajC
MDALTAAVASSGNIAVIVLLIVVLILFFMLRDERQAGREDRRAAIEALSKLSEVLVQVRIELAALRTQGDRR